MLSQVLNGALAISLTLWVAPALASGFGQRGVVVPQGELGLSITSVRPPEGDAFNATALTLHPSLMVFVKDNFALGGEVSFDLLKVGEADAATMFGIGGKIGFNIPFSHTVSLFPTASLGLRKGGGATTLPLAFDAALLFHFNNYFIGFGPRLELDLVSRIEGESGARTIVFAITTKLGGWIGGPGPGAMDDLPAHYPQDPVAPEPTRAPPTETETQPEEDDSDWDV